MIKVIFFGEVLVDMFLSWVSIGFEGQGLESVNEQFIKFLGGVLVNVVVVVGRLGGISYFVGKVGVDMFGEFLV